MDFLIIGINHQSAPVSVREKVAFSSEQLGEALPRLKTHAALEEVAILSTCNRTEIYAITPSNSPGLVTDWLYEYHQIESGALQSAIYHLKGKEAVTHIMKVAAGLDSMVLGEPQILGQMKDAFTLAQDNGTLGAQLNHLSQNTYRVAKKVRSETAIGENSVSVASTSVTLASQLFSDLSSCKTLLIGAGETIELVARHLTQAGINDFRVINRTLSNAEQLAAKINGSAAELSTLPDHLNDVDIIFSSTASQLPILGKGRVEKALKARKHRPIFMVDLAVPRDIEPEIANLADVYLYTIDDLQSIVSGNMDVRLDASVDAQHIIDNAVTDYASHHQSLQAKDLLVEFREKHLAVKDAELERALQRIKKGESPDEVLTSFANQLTNKLIHSPSVELKKAASKNQKSILEAVRILFKLPDDKT